MPLTIKASTMDLETVVKIEGYSVKYQEENEKSQAQSVDIKPAVLSHTPMKLLPGSCDFQKDNSTSATAIISFHPEIDTASTCKRLINAGESPLTKTKDFKGGSSRKEDPSAEEKYKCSISNCSKSFANKRILNIHLKYDHGQNWFKCHLCERIYSRNSVLKSHLVSHNTARPHNCNLCSKSFKYNCDLIRHKRELHQITPNATQNQPPFQHPESAKILVQTPTLIPILPKITSSFSFGAVPTEDVVLSSKSSTEKSELAKHESDPLIQPQISTTPVLILPGSTNRTEAEMEDLATAQKARLLGCSPQTSPLTTNKCGVCLKSFKSRATLGYHESRAHAPENEKQFKCHICPKSFVARPRLKQHLYLVHGEKSESLKIFECEFCGREFISVCRLEAHVVDKHVVDKEFKCSVCSKTFVDQGAVTKHQVQFHEQKKLNYFCAVCSDGFTKKGKLVDHFKRIHKKSLCHKCRRVFENKSEFNQHLTSEVTNNLEVGFKFQCQVCSVSLSTQCNFNIHNDNHLKESKSTSVVIFNTI